MAATPVFEVHDLTKVYRTGGNEVQALRGIDAVLKRRRDHRHARPLRQRQVNLRQHPGRARLGDLGLGNLSRRELSGPAKGN